MLTIYRRHEKSCRHRREGRAHRRCRCPIWADGSLSGREIRQSLGTRDWGEAQNIIREWEAKGRQTPTSESPPISIAQATDEFVSDATARNLKEKTVYKYRLLFRHLKKFAEIQGIRFVNELDTQTLRKFRATWKDSNLAAVKKLERLRSFFRFTQENGWVTDNPATKISNPKVTIRPTLPFSPDEVIRILAAAARKIEETQPQDRDNAHRLRALILLLRYSGLRIGDAVSCSVERLADGKLRLYTQKTGTHVHCPLHDFVVKELGSIPKMSERYWFWTGNGKLQTAVADWQGRLLDLFEGMQVEEFAQANKVTVEVARKQLEAKGCKIADGHAHRFRDTFAWSCYSPVFRSSAFRFFSAIRASRSLRSTTALGFVSARSKPRRM